MRWRIALLMASLTACNSTAPQRPQWQVGPGCTLYFNNRTSEIVQATVLHFPECPTVRMDSVPVAP